MLNPHKITMDSRVPDKILKNKILRKIYMGIVTNTGAMCNKHAKRTSLKHYKRADN